MKIQRKSIITGTVRERNMPMVTEEKLKEWRPANGNPGKPIQDVFPDLNADDREWLLSGTTKEEISEHLYKDKKK